MSRNASQHRVGARHALSGTLPPPLLTSAPLGWPDILVEVFRQHAMDVVTQSTSHLVSVQLSGTRSLYQSRNGRVSTQVLHPGTVIVVPAGEPKHWSHAEPVDMLVMHVPVDLVGDVAHTLSDGARAQPELRDDFGTCDPVIEQLGRTLASELRSPDALSGLLAQSAAQQLAVRLLRRHSNLPVRAQGPTLTRPKMRAAVEHIEAHLGGDLALAQIARAVALSPFHFAHAFRQEMGVTPHQYVVHRRMERAKELLRKTRLDVAEVGYRVGFPNHSHFCVAFQRATGVTPSTFRLMG